MRTRVKSPCRSASSFTIDALGGAHAERRTRNQRNDTGERSKHHRVAPGPFHTPGEQQRAQRRRENGQRLRRSLYAAQMPASKKARPDAEEQDHHEPATK